MATRLRLNDTIDVEQEVKRELLKQLRKVDTYAAIRQLNYPKGNLAAFIEPKKPLHLMWSGFFTLVDRRIELSNHIHKDFEAVDKYLQMGEG